MEGSTFYIEPREGWQKGEHRLTRLSTELPGLNKPIGGWMMEGVE